MSFACLVSKEVKDYLRSIDPMGDLPDDVVQLIDNAYMAGKTTTSVKEELDRYEFKRRCEEEADVLRRDVDFLQSKCASLNAEIERLEARR